MSEHVGMRHRNAYVVGFERFLASDADESELADAGELLLGELGCVACHLSNDGARLSARIDVKRGPRLRDVGRRVSPLWLRRYLLDPQAVKPGTTMPGLVRASGDAEALVHFLASKRAASDLPGSGDRLAADAGRGRELFHRVGCVACHEPDVDYRPVVDAAEVEREELRVSSVPLVDLDEKYTPGALARFLHSPLEVRPRGRMPDLALSFAEASDIATFLRSRQRGVTPERADSRAPVDFTVDPELARRGGALYHSLGCSACHHAPDAPPSEVLERSPKLVALAASDRSLAGGCLSRDSEADAPRYSLSKRQVRAIRLALGRWASGEISSIGAKERVERTLRSLNCYACHSREDRGGVDPGRRLYFRSVDEVDMGDEGRFPPHLTELGRKLKPEWLHGVISGRHRLRPYMWTRMPHFDLGGEDGVDSFVRDVRAADRRSSDAPYEVIGRNRYGRALVGMEGVRCVQCHDLAGHKSLGIRALDLASTAERLEPLWFREFLLDPASKRPGSRMPAMWPGGESLFPKILGGNTSKQLDATYIYLMESRQTRLPVGMERKDMYELLPEDRPILLRTFMKDVGARAVAFGLPGAVNGAFDASSGRLALLWRGRFLDAEGTWDDRFAPFEEPLSADRHTLPSGPAIVGGDGLRVSQYRGYRLDLRGAPVFHWQLGGLVVEERISVSARGEGWIRRRLDVRDVRTTADRAASRPHSVLVYRDSRIRRLDGDELRFEASDGTKLCVVASGGRPIELRLIEGDKPATRQIELHIPLVFEDGLSRVEVDLSW